MNTYYMLWTKKANGETAVMLTGNKRATAWDEYHDQTRSRVYIQVKLFIINIIAEKLVLLAEWAI